MLLEAFALIGGGVLGVGDGGNGGREFCDKNIESAVIGQPSRTRKGRVIQEFRENIKMEFRLIPLSPFKLKRWFVDIQLWQKFELEFSRSIFSILQLLGERSFLPSVDEQARNKRLVAFLRKMTLQTCFIFKGIGSKKKKINVVINFLYSRSDFFFALISSSLSLSSFF